MDLFAPRRSNQPSDATPKKEVPNGGTTWDFNDLGARVSCSCSRYHRAARKLFNISNNDFFFLLCIFPRSFQGCLFKYHP